MNFPKRTRMFVGSEKKECFNLKVLWKQNIVAIFIILPARINEVLFFCSVSTLRDECCRRVLYETDERGCVISESKKIKSFELEYSEFSADSNDSVIMSLDLFSIAETELVPLSRKTAKQKKNSEYFCNRFIISLQM